MAGTAPSLSSSPPPSRPSLLAQLLTALRNQQETKCYQHQLRRQPKNTATLRADDGRPPGPPNRDRGSHQPPHVVHVAADDANAFRDIGNAFWGDADVSHNDANVSDDSDANVSDDDDAYVFVDARGPAVQRRMGYVSLLSLSAFPSPPNA